MNFKPTKWKVIVFVLIIILNQLIHVYYSATDSNLLIKTAPSIFVYIIWSLFEKKK